MGKNFFFKKNKEDSKQKEKENNQGKIVKNYDMTKLDKIILKRLKKNIPDFIQRESLKLM